jgi:uncharacterized protein YkwD
VTTSLLGALVAVLLGAGFSVPWQPPQNDVANRPAPQHERAAGSSADHAQDVAVMLADINGRRATRGLRMLVLDERLCDVALEHALDMAERNYFDHTAPDGTTPFDRMGRANIRFSYAGENIALDQSPVSADDALWHSSEHRRNILEPHFSRIGIAAVDGPEGELFVEDFSD